MPHVPDPELLPFCHGLLGVDHLADKAAEVAHDGYATLVFQTRGSYDPEQACRAISGGIGCSNESKVAHVGNAKFRADCDPDALGWIRRNALIEDFHQFPLLFEHLKKFPHAFNVCEFRLTQNIHRALDVNSLRT